MLSGESPFCQRIYNGNMADDRWLKSEINRIGDEAESTEDEVSPFLPFQLLLLLVLTISKKNT